MTTIVIGGAMRSGTTLLNNILCTAKGANPHIAECQFLTRILNVYIASKAGFPTMLHGYFPSPEAFDDYYRSSIQSLLDSTMAMHQCQNLVLKNPEITIVIPEFAALFPEIKFIVMMRDPRDNIASIAEVGQKMQAKNSNHVLSTVSKTIDHLCQYYLYYYQAIFARRAEINPQNLLIMPYEHIIGHTQEAVTTLQTFTGLDLSAYNPKQEWQNLAVSFNELRVKEPSFDTKLIGKPIVDESIGRYKTFFTPAQIAAIEKYCEPIMKEFNYHPFESNNQ